MALLDYLFPKNCVGCQKWGAYICPNCFSGISFETIPTCYVCQKQSITGLTHPKCLGKYTLDGVFPVVLYKGIIKKLLYQFKYEPYLSDLKTILSEIMYEGLIQQEIFMKKALSQAVFSPIPLSVKRRKERSYNHAELLSQELGKKLGVLTQATLKRIKETKPQYNLGRQERRQNLKDVFGMKTKGVVSVVLVDDIVTTGATLLEAAKILKKNGTQTVYAAIFAQEGKCGDVGE
ncbi:MAG TPA: ComF family protein [Patescibacteria group bacterium]|nr:ComF family protein [Patescibacteria group bacterium]